MVPIHVMKQLFRNDHLLCRRMQCASMMIISLENTPALRPPCPKIYREADKAGCANM